MGTGVFGVAFITTVAIPISDIHPLRSTVSSQIPAQSNVISFRVKTALFVTIGLFGHEPFVQVYVAPDSTSVEKSTSSPRQTGVSIVATGAAEVLLTVTSTVTGSLAHPFTVTIKVYSPSSESAAVFIVGFCSLKLFGPVHW